MVLQFVIFIAALSILVFSAKTFTSAAEAIGKYMKLSQFVIGAFIVGIGTSLPELVTGIISITNNNSEILSGNIIGANISNLLLVTGIAIAVNRNDIFLTSFKIKIDLHFLLGSFFLFWIIAYDGKIQFIEATIGMALYIFYNFYILKESSPATTELNEIEAEKEANNFPSKSLFFLLAGSVGIYFGAEYTVDSISTIAENFHVPSSIIALTVLSLGTTLPEIAVNISAVKQKKPEMAIGNVLGSCMFNTLAIPGISSVFGPIQITDNLLSFSFPVMIGSGVLFYLLNLDKRLSFWEGILFVLIYVAFLMHTIG
jgi:cation:H+ antiporter